MIDINKMNLIPINEMTGFIYNGELYLDLCSSMSILGFEKFNENYDSTYLWSNMYKEFYSTLHQLRINPDDYCIPLIQQPEINTSGAMSEYKYDLPAYIVETILVKIAERKRDKGITLNYVKTIISLFKDNRRIVSSEFINLKNRTLKSGFRINEVENRTQDSGLNKEIEMKNINIVTCEMFSLPLRGFVKEGIIYLNTKEAAFSIGLTKQDNISSPKRVRWDKYYEFYLSTSTMLGGVNLNGITLSNGTSNRGPRSGYEQKMPEYIPLMVVLGIASYLTNFHAINFKMEFLKNSLPFFLNNASDEDINNVNFLRNIKPLLDERERQLGIESRQQAIQQAQYMEMQYQNYIRSLQQFNQNMYYQGLRPAIPGGNANFSGMAYIMPKPEDIQKNLDSQPKHLKEVVRFEDPNKMNN